jgi:di/tricarboxylate transporter
MALNAYFTIGILALTFALLIKTKLPPMAIFMGALTLSMSLRIAPLADSLKGFSNSGVLTIGALYMVAAGMYSTGAISMIADWLIGRPKTLLAAQMKMLPPVAIGSAFLNNTPLVAMMIPVIRDVCRISRLASTRLYIPLSYASILGGTCTLIGTATNLVISGMLLDLLAEDRPNMPPMRAVEMFDPSWIGVPVALIGIGFIMLFSKWLLPDPKEREYAAELKRFYGAEFVVEKNSPLVGQTLQALGFFNQAGFRLLSVERSEGIRPEIEAGFKLKAGDLLTFSSDVESLPGLWSTHGLLPHIVGPRMQKKMQKERYTNCLAEVVVSRRSSIVGRKIKELPLPDEPYRVNIVAVSRAGKPVDRPLFEVRIKAGDIAVLEADDGFFYENRNETEFAVTKRLTEAHIQRYDRAVAATVITVAMVIVVAFGWMSMLNAALIASGLMLLTGCLTLKSAGRSVEISTLVVIASAIGLEAALTGSGLSSTIANLLTRIGGDNPYVGLAVVYFGCILMNTLVTNVASAVFMFPIALGLASNLNVSFMPFVITLMVGASCSFISPVSYQTNLMVFGPGGYKFVDYVRIGVPLNLLVGIVTVLLVPLIFRF